MRVRSGSRKRRPRSKNDPNLIIMRMKIIMVIDE
jgi:hypothetical protein